MDSQNEWMTIERTPGAEWIVESARHLAGAENQGRHHIFVDALGPDGADLRGTGLAVAFGWEGMAPDDAQAPAPIDKPAGEYGCHIPIIDEAVMHVAIHGAPSEVVRGMRTTFDDGEEGNSWGRQSFHVVFRYVPPPQTAAAPPKPRSGRRAADKQQPPAQEAPAAPPQPTTTWTLHRGLPNITYPRHTTMFSDQIGAIIVETAASDLFLTSLVFANGARIGQNRFMRSLDDAKRWAEEQAATIISSMEKVQQN